jgi:hypothetical protein
MLLSAPRSTSPLSAIFYSNKSLLWPYSWSCYLSTLEILSTYIRLAEARNWMCSFISMCLTNRNEAVGEIRDRKKRSCLHSLNARALVYYDDAIVRRRRRLSLTSSIKPILWRVSSTFRRRVDRILHPSSGVLYGRLSNRTYPASLS